MCSEFISTLPALLPVNDHICDQLLQKLKPVHMQRGKHLQLEGEICDRLWFVKTGLVRGYQMKDDGCGHCIDLTSWFARENDFFHDPESFVGQIPSHEYMEVLEPSTLIYLLRSDLYSLYDQFPEIRCLGRIIAERSWLVQKQLICEMRSLTAAQRLEAFHKRSADLVRRVPQKHIASYLGISENYVSKLRAKK